MTSSVNFICCALYRMSQIYSMDTLIDTAWAHIVQGLDRPKAPHCRQFQYPTRDPGSDPGPRIIIHIILLLRLEILDRQEVPSENLCWKLLSFLYCVLIVINYVSHVDLLQQLLHTNSNMKTWQESSDPPSLCMILEANCDGVGWVWDWDRI